MWSAAEYHFRFAWETAGRSCPHAPASRMTAIAMNLMMFWEVSAPAVFLNTISNFLNNPAGT